VSSAKERVKTGRTIILLAVFAVLMVSRRPDQLANPQFYADDGSGFFADAVRSGWACVFTPYNGYLLLLPRIVAVALTKAMPWEFLPLAFSLSALTICSLIALRIAQISPSGLAAFGMMVALVAVPNNGGGAPFLNLCCLHFFFAVLIVLECWSGSATSWSAAGRGSMLVVAALSCPEPIIILPVILWRIWVQRANRAACWPLIGLAGGAVVQLLIVLAVGRRRLAVQGIMGRILLQLPQVMSFYSSHLFAEFADMSSASLIAYLLLIFVVAVLVWSFLDSGNPFRSQAAGCILCALLLLIAGRMVNPGWPDPVGAGSRYVLPVFALAMMSLVLLCYGTECRARKFALGFLLLAVISSALVCWQCVPYTDFNWRHQVAEVRAGRCRSFVIPPGWSFPVPIQGRAPAP
jgi:hypothetical protein